MIRAYLRSLLAPDAALLRALQASHTREAELRKFERRDFRRICELMEERDADREVARQEIADRDAYAVELLGWARRWKALAGRLRAQREEARDKLGKTAALAEIEACTCPCHAGEACRS